MEFFLFIYFFLVDIIIIAVIIDCRSEDVDIMITEEEFDKTSGALKEMLNSICDYAHDRCVKVMTARAKVGL